MPSPDEILAALLTAHGVVVVVNPSGGLDLPEVAMRASAEFFPAREPSSYVRGQLDLRLELWPGRTIVESAAALGDDDVAAVNRAFGVLSANVLHVWLAAFLRPDAANEQVVRERWVVGGRERDVIVGEATMNGEMQLEPVHTLVDTLVASLVHRDVGEGVHWIRVFTSQLDDRRQVMETLLDNRPWPELQRELERLPVPTTSGYASARFFLVVASERMDAGRAATLIATFGAGMDDDALVRLIVSHGAARDHAERLVSFVVSAFGHALVESLGVAAPSGAFVELQDGSRLAFELGAQPDYVAARAYAQSVMSNGPRVLMKALASRSAELGSVNQALFAGQRVEDMSLGRSTYYWLTGLVGATLVG